MFKELKKWSERIISRLRHSSSTSNTVYEADNTLETIDPRELPRPSRDPSVNIKGFFADETSIDRESPIMDNNNTLSDLNDNNGTIYKSQTKIDSDYCNCYNCKILFNDYAECAICTEPLQSSTAVISHNEGGGISECNSCGNICCYQCSQKLTKCAFCRQPYIHNSFPMFLNDRIRSLAFERLLAKIKLPCRNARYGCKEYLTLDVRLEHEINCPYSPLGCPYCSWQGEGTNIIQHLRDTHKISVVPANGIDMEINDFRAKLKAANDKCRRYCISLLCHGNIYVCKVNMHKNKLKLCFHQIDGNFFNNFQHNSGDNRKFAAWIEISSAYKTLKGILPILKSKHSIMKQLEIPCDSLFAHTNNCNKKIDNNLIRISITIRQFLV